MVHSELSDPKLWDLNPGADLYSKIGSNIKKISIQISRAGSGYFFSGPGRIRAGRFWPGSGSGWPFLASGQFGLSILDVFGPFLDQKLQYYQSSKGISETVPI